MAEAIIMKFLMNGSNLPDVAPKPAKALGTALWAAQIILAALFLFAGVMKFVMPVEEMTRGSSLPGSFFHFIGVMEVLGGIGLVLPSLLRISPFLTPVAACGLLIIMAGATVTSIPMGWISLFPFFVGIVAAFVAYGRFKLLPIQPRL
jgi:uncharacterized membrane protein YphA (DoxX/SURF4 family)